MKLVQDFEWGGEGNSYDDQNLVFFVEMRTINIDMPPLNGTKKDKKVEACKKNFSLFECAEIEMGHIRKPWCLPISLTDSLV